MGSIFTTYYITKALSIISYDLAINVGMAASYDHFLEQGFVLNVIQDEFGDLGIETNDDFYTLPEMEMMNENQAPFDGGKLRLLETFDIMEVETLIPVKSVTVNTVHGQQESIDRIRRKFNPDIETTEGAAFVYTCQKENIPCMQIRCVSHYVDINKVENWNIPVSLKNLRNSVINILDELNIRVAENK